MKIPTDYSIRAAIQADSPTILEIIASCLKDYGLALDTKDVDACVLDLEGNYQRPGGIFEVLLDAHQRLIGCYGLLPRGNQEATSTVELRKMYLLSSHRGKGLGKFLMQRAIHQAKRLNFKRIELETASVLKEAVGLYKAFGFQTMDKAHIPERCDSAMSLEI
jgi:putative acetyltransferase